MVRPIYRRRSTARITAAPRHIAPIMPKNSIMIEIVPSPTLLESDRD